MALKFLDIKPEIGDRFKFTPTEDGSINQKAIEIIEDRNHPILNKSDLEKLVKLFEWTRRL